MTTGLSLSGSTFVMGNNGFSTANRYPRQVANPVDATAAMVEGPSFAVNARTVGAGSVRMTWRFECGALGFSSAYGTEPIPSVGFAIDRLIGL